MIVEKIYRGDGKLYLTRIALMPETRWGWLQLHVFHSADNEVCHDHPFDFWTFPLSTYMEEVCFGLCHVGRRIKIVERFKWHKRPHSYAHRVLGRPVYTGPGNVWTLMWRTPKIAEWGFFVDGEKIPWHVYRNAPSM